MYGIGLWKFIKKMIRDFVFVNHFRFMGGGGGLESDFDVIFIVGIQPLNIFSSLFNIVFTHDVSLTDYMDNSNGSLKLNVRLGVAHDWMIS